MNTTQYVPKWFAALALAIALVACPAPPKPTNDTDPDTAIFTAVSSADLSTLVTSNQITVTGINAAAEIKIVGGEYQIDNGTFKTTPDSIQVGNKVRVRTTAANVQNQSKEVQLTIGTIVFRFAVTTKSTVNDINFASAINKNWASEIESNEVTLTNINPGTTISINGAGGTYKINTGAYTTGNGTVNNGDKVTVKAFTASADNTSTSTTLTVGSVSRMFIVTTGKRTPNTFTLAAQSEANPNTVYISTSTLTLSSITIPSPITITGGEYSINGVFSAVAGSVNPNDVITVRGTSKTIADGSVQTVALSIGGQTTNFVITNKNWNPTINFANQTVAPDVSTAERYWTGTTRCTIYEPDPATDCPGLSGDARYQQPPLAQTGSSTLIESNIATLAAGISPSTPISIANGEYSINGGAYTNAIGVVNSGSTLRLRQQNTVFSGTLKKAVLTFGTLIPGATSTFTNDFNVTTNSAPLANVWTSNAAIPAILVPSNGTTLSTLTVPTTTAKVAKVKVLVTLDGNFVRRSHYIIRVIPPTGSGASPITLMDFYNQKPLSAGYPSINPLDPRANPAPLLIPVPLIGGVNSEQPWPFTSIGFNAFDGGWGGNVNAIFDSSNFGTNYAAGASSAPGTDTTLDGGVNRNDVYRRCGTSNYAAQKRKYVDSEIDTAGFPLAAPNTDVTDLASLNAKLKRDLPRAGAIDPYTGIADTRTGTPSTTLGNPPEILGEYTDGTCSRNTDNVFYPPIVPVQSLTSLNNTNPSGVWTLEIQDVLGRPAETASLNAFKLIFDLIP